jgi:hypothetical protein
MLYTICLLLFVSGAAWAWAQRLDHLGEASDALRRWKPFFLKLHGYSAVGFVLLLGGILSGHVRRAWHAHKNRLNGAFFLSVVGVLTATGYTLYYLGNETLRNAASNVHLWLGLASPILLCWHIWSGQKSTGGK